METDPESENSKPRVLVVDDDDQIRHLMAIVLAKAGIVADTAADGAEALKKIGASNYELVLLDLMMPRVDGFEVIRQLQQTGSETPVVVVSASPQTAEIDPVLVRDVIRKPFDVRQLVTSVRQFIEGGGQTPLTA